eukprot:GHVS01053223.1.p1 GENE.GHVS01053223.1~~GHVS01053223.1.p1  ORF type:complete len:692 (+),score=129.73 GHVS01053223.1:96-2171(+)
MSSSSPGKSHTSPPTPPSGSSTVPPQVPLTFKPTAAEADGSPHISHTQVQNSPPTSLTPAPDPHHDSPSFVPSASPRFCPPLLSPFPPEAAWEVASDTRRVHVAGLLPRRGKAVTMAAAVMEGEKGERGGEEEGSGGSRVEVEGVERKRGENVNMKVDFRLGRIPSDVSSFRNLSRGASLGEIDDDGENDDIASVGRVPVAEGEGDIAQTIRRTGQRLVESPRKVLHRLGTKRTGWTSTAYRTYQRCYVVIEVFEGCHRIHEWQCGDLLKAVHKEQHVTASNTGILTYRDCRQVFSDVARPIPSIEIRRGCVVVCLPPVMGFVLHDKVYLLFVEELRGDSLIQQLVELTKLHYSSTISEEETVTGTSDSFAETKQLWKDPSPSQFDKRLIAKGEVYAKKRRTAKSVQKGEEEEKSQRCAAPAVGNYRIDERFSSVVEEGWAASSRGARLATGDTAAASADPLGSAVYPFEYGAIECLMSASFDQLNVDISQIEEQLEVINSKVRKKLSPSALLLEDLHSVKQPIGLYEDRVAAFDKVLNELLVNPADMSKMDLSKWQHDRECFDAPDGGGASNKAIVVDADLEIMLEYFDQEMDQFTERVRHMREMVSNIERLMSLRLALMRNKLIYLELAATIIATGIAVGTCLSGIFGMNMRSGFEESHDAFVFTAVSVTLISLVSLIIVAYVVCTMRL